MRTLQVINNLELAGAERLVHDLCLEFKRRGVPVSVFLLETTGSPLENELRDFRIPVFSSGVTHLHSPLQALSLADHLRTCSYDVVHAHLFPAQLWTAVASALSHSATRFFTTEHSYTTRRRRWFARPLDTWLYGRFKSVCCVSEAAAANFRTWMPGRSGNTIAIPNGIDTRRFNIAHRTHAEQTRIISVGRCETVKRHDVTLRAIAAVPDASLWIAGNGPDRTQLVSLAEKLGVAERLTLLGRRNDVDALLPQCGIFVQSSDHEGFGLAALEAMACGLPVVCSDIPALREVVGSAALTFAPGDHAQLAGCLRSILSNPRLAKAMSGASRERARSFSITATADRYLQLYGGAPVPVFSVAPIRKVNV